MTLPLPLPETMFHVEQPEKVEFEFDGIFCAQLNMVKAGYMVQQHKHAYDHYTLLAAGRVRVWVDGRDVVDHWAPMPIFVAKGLNHQFQALEDNTVLYCLHNAKHLEVLDKEMDWPPTTVTTP